MKKSKIDSLTELNTPPLGEMEGADD